jgi:RNA polymerase sigma-70 factor (ECF subfamily)
VILAEPGNPDEIVQGGGFEVSRKTVRLNWYFESSPRLSGYGFRKRLDPLVPDDVELVKACIAGEPEACRAFVGKYQAHVFGVCFRMLGHREDAEDVSQEVFSRAFRNLHQWDMVRPLRPWLLTIAANRCRTWLSRFGRRPISAEFVEEARDRTASTEGTDLAEELQRALERLREDYRLCFVLYYQNELGLAEISEIVGSPEGTIKTWLYRARKELAEYLQRRGIAPQVNHELR